MRSSYMAHLDSSQTDRSGLAVTTPVSLQLTQKLALCMTHSIRLGHFTKGTVLLLQRRNEECYAPVIQILKYLVNPDLKEGSGSGLAVQGGLPAAAIDEAKAGILRVRMLLVCSIRTASGHALALANWSIPHVQECIFHWSDITCDA